MPPSVIHIGVDPGKNGGAVAVRDGHVVSVTPLGTNPARHGREVVEWIESLGGASAVRVYVEGVTMGTALVRSQATICGALGGAGVTYHIVQPAAWQRAAGIAATQGNRYGGASAIRTAHKRSIKAAAARLLVWGEHRITGRYADAAVIAAVLEGQQ